MSEYPSYLIHYGVPGQKWGERRWQNEDGTWTEEGKERRRVNPKDLPHYGGKGIQAPLSSAGYFKRNKYGFYHLDDKINKIKTGKVKGPDETDYVVKKGSIYKRITSQENEKFNKRMYVGGGEINTSGYDDEYINDYVQVLNDLMIANNVYVDTLETKRDVIIAGKNTVESILREIGGEDANKIIEAFNTDDKEKPIKPTKKYGLFGGETKAYKKYKKEYDIWEKERNEKYDRIDFLYKDKYKIADQFIKKLKDRGYDGLADPADGVMLKGRDIDPDATIFINDVLKRTNQKKYI